MAVGQVPAFVDISRDQPRHRRDVAIPGPGGFVGMAVVAGASQRRRHWRWRTQDLRGRWIVVMDRHELYQYDEAQQR